MPAPTLTSRRHPLVARCRDAADGHADEVLLDGPHLVAEALVARTPLLAVLISEGVEHRPEISALLARAEAAAVPVHLVTPAVLDAASPTRSPAGVVALARLALRDVDALLASVPALVTVAVDVQDPGNLGTLMRSSEAVGATGLIAAGTTAHPFGWRALRGSMGSALRLPVARESDALAALTRLRGEGVTIVALSADAGMSFDEAVFTGPVAICAGAEGQGLSSDVLALADVRVAIAMYPPVESLNVGVATSLVLFEAMRQRRHHAVGRAGSPSRPPAHGPFS